jgi:hypothetical protein
MRHADRERFLAPYAEYTREARRVKRDFLPAGRTEPFRNCVARGSIGLPVWCLPLFLSRSSGPRGLGADIMRRAHHELSIELGKAYRGQKRSSSAVESLANSGFTETSGGVG